MSLFGFENKHKIRNIGLGIHNKYWEHTSIKYSWLMFTLRALGSTRSPLEQIY